MLGDNAAPHACTFREKKQWTRCSEVHSFLKEDPYRPRQPLEIETKKKAGIVVQKIRSSICRSLLF